jgi:hypothetical protein
MANLSTVDMKLIDSLSGMYGGYVLNLATRRSHRLLPDIVDIYDDAYAVHALLKANAYGAARAGIDGAAVRLHSFIHD